ncbi:MAG: zf-HC2 domain-containing protein [Vicinamibacterales bacterium]
MRSCEELEPLFAAYVDGEGAADEREAVQRHLARCVDCRHAVEHQHTIRAALRSCRGRLGAHASPELRNRCQACACAPRAWWRGSGAGRGATPRWLPLSFAATMIIGVTAVFLIVINGGDKALAASLAIDHVKCFQFAPEHGSVDPITAAERWKVAYGWLLAIPNSASVEQLELLEVRRCLSTQGGSAHIMYRWHGEPLSVYVLNSVAKSDGHVERLVTSVGEQAVIWSDGGRTYAVVGRAKPADLTHIAHYLREFAR